MLHVDECAIRPFAPGDCPYFIGLVGVLHRHDRHIRVPARNPIPPAAQQDHIQRNRIRSTMVAVVSVCVLVCRCRIMCWTICLFCRTTPLGTLPSPSRPKGPQSKLVGVPSLVSSFVVAPVQISVSPLPLSRSRSNQ